MSYRVCTNCENIHAETEFYGLDLLCPSCLREAKREHAESAERALTKVEALRYLASKRLHDAEDCAKSVDDKYLAALYASVAHTWRTVLAELNS